MENLIILGFDILLWTVYLFIGITIALLVQGISYRVFHKNPYKWLKYNLIDKELKYDK